MLSSSYPPVLGGYYLNLRENGDLSPACACCCGYENLTPFFLGKGGRSEIAQEGNSILAVKFLQDFSPCSNLGPMQTGLAGLWQPELPRSAHTLPHVHSSVWQLFAWNTKGGQPDRLRVGQVSLRACQEGERKGSIGGNRISESRIDGLGGAGY